MEPDQVRGRFRRALTHRRDIQSHLPQARIGAMQQVCQVNQRVALAAGGLSAWMLRVQETDEPVQHPMRAQLHFKSETEMTPNVPNERRAACGASVSI